MEEIEQERHRDVLDKDVMPLVDKYTRKMEWDIPEVNEAKAQQMIPDEIRQAIGRIENRSRGTATFIRIPRRVPSVHYNIVRI